MNGFIIWLVNGRSLDFPDAGPAATRVAVEWIKDGRPGVLDLAVGPDRVVHVVKQQVTHIEEYR